MRRATRRVPVNTSLNIEDFAGGSILAMSCGVTNGIFAQYPDQRWYITQRPAVNLLEKASTTVADARGRGCYFWSQTGHFFIVNDGEVYRNTYGTPVREAAKSVGTLTHASTTATVGLVGHGYSVGDTVLIADAVEPEYNGRQLVDTVPDVDTFTYVLASASGTPATGTITARRVFGLSLQRAYIFELETYLVILDPDNNEGWYITAAATTVLNKITDANFPDTLARGGSVLNGRLYVLDEPGVVYNSAEGDPRSWGALDVISANHSPDTGVALAGHRKHLVAFGANTVEFFYDAGNPQGSPLAKRMELVHEIGAVAEDTFWSDNDTTFFVGVSRTGGLEVYVLADFQIKPISTSDIASFLTTAYLKENRKFVGQGAVVGGRIFYLLTVYLGGDEVTSSVTLAFNALTQTWTLWDLMYPAIDGCPMIDWTLSTSSVVSKGVLTNGDIVTFQDDFVPQDLVGALGPFESGIFETGIFLESGGLGEPIEMTIITGSSDLGTRNRKRADSCRIVGNRTETSQVMRLSWADERNTVYSAARDLDLSVPGQRVSRLGSFRQRNNKLAGAPTERAEIEALEYELQLFDA